MGNQPPGRSTPWSTCYHVPRLLYLQSLCPCSRCSKMYKILLSRPFHQVTASDHQHPSLSTAWLSPISILCECQCLPFLVVQKSTSSQQSEHQHLTCTAIQPSLTGKLLCSLTSVTLLSTSVGLHCLPINGHCSPVPGGSPSYIS